MKKILLFGFIICLVLISGCEESPLKPIKNLENQEEINYCQNISFTGHIETKCMDLKFNPSEEKYPDCRQDDYLHISNIKIINNNNCIIEGILDLTIDVMSLYKNESQFPLFQERIEDGFKPNEIYELSFNRSNFRYCDKKSCSIKIKRYHLEEQSTWEIIPKLNLNLDSNYSWSGFSYSFLINNKNIKTFEVYSRKQLDILHLAERQDQKSNYALIISLITVFVMLWIANRTIKKQKQVAKWQIDEQKNLEDNRLEGILNSLLAVLDYLDSPLKIKGKRAWKGNLIAAKQEFKNNKILTFKIIFLDLSLYFGRLYSWRNINFKNVIQNLTLINQKIEIINKTMKEAGYIQKNPYCKDMLDTTEFTLKLIKETKDKINNIKNEL